MSPAAGIYLLTNLLLTETPVPEVLRTGVFLLVLSFAIFELKETDIRWAGIFLLLLLLVPTLHVKTVPAAKIAVDVILVSVATSLGNFIGERAKEREAVFPVVIAASLADFGSVYRGLSLKAVEATTNLLVARETAKEAVAQALRAGTAPPPEVMKTFSFSFVDLFTVSSPVPGGVLPAVGVGDLILSGLLLGMGKVFGFKSWKCWASVFLGLTSASATANFLSTPVPAIPFIGLFYYWLNLPDIENDLVANLMGLGVGIAAFLTMVLVGR